VVSDLFMGLSLQVCVCVCRIDEFNGFYINSGHPLAITSCQAITRLEAYVSVSTMASQPSMRWLKTYVPP
jgi:hypothetical protein